MDKLQLPQAKLLYAVSELYKKRRIDLTQKRILKEKIITDNVEIYEILEQNQQENVLLEKLVALVKINEESIILCEDAKQDAEAIVKTEQQQASSPWGQFLRRKKGNNQNKHRGQTNELKGLINPLKAQ